MSFFHVLVWRQTGGSLLPCAQSIVLGGILWGNLTPWALPWRYGLFPRLHCQVLPPSPGSADRQPRASCHHLGCVLHCQRLAPGGGGAAEDPEQEKPQDRQTWSIFPRHSVRWEGEPEEGTGYKMRMNLKMKPGTPAGSAAAPGYTPRPLGVTCPRPSALGESSPRGSPVHLPHLTSQQPASQGGPHCSPAGLCSTTTPKPLQECR